MVRKTFTTTIDQELVQKFKAKCKSDNVSMNEMLEMFMKKYLDDKVVVMKVLDFNSVDGGCKDE